MAKPRPSSPHRWAVVERHSKFGGIRWKRWEEVISRHKTEQAALARCRNGCIVRRLTPQERA